jgi:hypothetical protein
MVRLRLNQSKYFPEQSLSYGPDLFLTEASLVPSVFGRHHLMMSLLSSIQRIPSKTHLPKLSFCSNSSD